LSVSNARLEMVQVWQPLGKSHRSMMGFSV
jgi:hypothetical protein